MPKTKTKNKIGLPLAEIHGKLAVHKAVSDDTYKELNGLLQPGVHQVHQAFLVEGTLKKGSPFLQRFPAKVNQWALIARLMSKLNAATLESVVAESLEVGEQEELATKAIVQAAIERLVASTEQEVGGKLNAALVLKLL